VERVFRGKTLAPLIFGGYCAQCAGLASLIDIMVNLQVARVFLPKVVINDSIFQRAAAVSPQQHDFQAGSARPSGIYVTHQNGELVDMTFSPAPPTVWIIDDDLGFVWWLGEIFIQARCQPFPALTCEQALSLMTKLKVGADLIVINPHLRGVSAMLDTFNRSNRNLKIVALRNPSEPQAADAISEITLERPSRTDRMSPPEWLKKIRKLLKQAEVVVPSRR